MTRRKKIILGAVGLLLLCCLGSFVSAIFFPSSDDTSETASGSRSEIADITEVEAESTGTPEATSTRKPPASTSTPNPTNTATSTTTPSPTIMPATNTLTPTNEPSPTAIPTQPPPTSTTAPTSTPIPATAVPTQPPPPPTAAPTQVPQPTSPPAPTEPLPVSSSDVKITFVRFNGDINPSEPDEYAVIQNTGAGTINLSGWRLNAGNPGQDFNFPGIDLGPGQSCRVYTNQVQPDSCGGSSFGSGSAIWLNSGDCGYLFDNIGAQVSQYCYSG